MLTLSRFAVAKHLIVSITSGIELLTIPRMSTGLPKPQRLREVSEPLARLCKYRIKGYNATVLKHTFLGKNCSKKSSITPKKAQ
jgi:hypothetical protein